VTVLPHSAPVPVPRGITGVGIFLLFGTVMAFIGGTTLVWPGTALDHAWACPSRACAPRPDDRNSFPLAWSHTFSGCSRLVPTRPLGMAARRRSDRRAGHRKYCQSFPWSHRGRCDGLRHRHCAPRLFPASSRQNCFSLMKFHERLEVNLLMMLFQAMSTARPAASATSSP
jgi:hypothetical protein